MAKGWHYQVMRHKVIYGDQEHSFLAVHEYYPADIMGEEEGGDGWTEDPVSVTGDDINDIKWMLKAILNDLEKYGIKEYN